MYLIASDLLWYPVKGEVKVTRAPDVMVVEGRPKREREMVGAYLQWLEGNIAPRLVIEVRSGSDRASVLRKKFEFYEAHGVEEYYLVDPISTMTEAWYREGDRLVKVEDMKTWVSPTTGLRFEAGGEFNIAYPDGTPIQYALDQLQEVSTRCEEVSTRYEQEQEQREKVEALLKQEQEVRRKEQEAREQAETRLESLLALVRKAGLDPDTDLS